MKFRGELNIRVGSNAFQTNCPTEDLVLSLAENAYRHFESQSFNHCYGFEECVRFCLDRWIFL